ncbi:hypothetical protein GCM10011331_13250 [Flavimobilis marinus]|uniref:ScoMcrA-like N-terminal head domain-containing protein n=1 Tax=Flavimobilis marinus TaxID=285351 RepID=A0A1I2G1N5_9MICO|nr:hypothetical protein [Flavimobilis marinus]GHG50528.1 hypothetical protein GCM10011331_13250 [Flavimobilis marinus]SFF10937.1 hypothetical protein SAMN04488035_1643 [Flavimobilis marinus]
MATFSSVTRQHILQAIAEYDDRGVESFLGVYGFTPSRGDTLVHEGKTYDSRAILGVAHRYATGRVATAEEFGGGKFGVADLLRKRGFEIAELVRTGGAATPAKAPRKAAAPRKPAVPERVAPICPTCFMTLPGTGVCDNCG